MNPVSWLLGCWCARSARPARAHPRVRPFLELLETRLVPAFLGPLFRVATLAGNQNQTDNATAPNGAAVVVWDTPGAVYAQRLDRAGHKVGAALVVDAGKGTHADPQVAADARGNFVVTWLKTIETSPTDGVGVEYLQARRYSARGAALGKAFSVASVSRNFVAPQFDQVLENPAVGMTPSGSFTVAYDLTPQAMENFVIQARQYAANGRALRTVVVPTNPDSSGSTLAGFAVAPSGSFMVADGLMGITYLYSAAGTMLASFNPSGMSSVALDADGSLLVFTPGGHAFAHVSAQGTVGTPIQLPANIQTQAMVPDGRGGYIILTQGSPMVNAVDVSATGQLQTQGLVSSQVTSAALSGNAKRSFLVTLTNKVGVYGRIGQTP